MAYPAQAGACFQHRSAWTGVPVAEGDVEYVCLLDANHVGVDHAWVPMDQAVATIEVAASALSRRGRAAAVRRAPGHLPTPRRRHRRVGLTPVADIAPASVAWPAPAVEPRPRRRPSLSWRARIRLGVRAVAVALVGGCGIAVGSYGFDSFGRAAIATTAAAVAACLAFALGAEDYLAARAARGWRR